MENHELLWSFAVLCVFASSSFRVWVVNGENPYRFYEWNVTYGTISPLGVPQEGILINGVFPGPEIYSVTNDNININVHNNLREPFLVSMNGILQRKDSWKDGVYGTTCPIPPGKNHTFTMHFKDQIGSFFYFPSLDFHKAAGGFGAIRVLSRPMIPVPFDPPTGDYNVLIGDWYKTNYSVKTIQGFYPSIIGMVLKKVMDGGNRLLFPDGILINGQGPNSASFNVGPGKTYRLRISNVGLQNTLNFRIQGHMMKLVEVEGTHTQQNTYTSLDIHVGQSYSVLITADQASKDYYIAVSTRFTSKLLESTAILHYTNSDQNPSGTIPDAPTDVTWSLNQARSILTNLTASGPRPNPQGAYHYGKINVTRTIRLGNSAGQINNKQRYAVNKVSFVPADTPLKLADHFKIDGVFRLGRIPDENVRGSMHLETAVMAADFRDFVEIVFENKESILQSWHLDGYFFFVVGMDGGTWSTAAREQYNLQDAVTRSTVQVYPRSWTAVYMAFDNVGMWNLRSQFWARRYLGQEFYIRVYSPVESPRDEYPMPPDTPLCGRALGKSL